MKKIFIVAATIIGSLVQAQQEKTDTMEQVIVTANRFLQPKNQTGKVVTVISRSDLDLQSGRTLADILNRQGGLTVVGAQNNLGTNADVFLQGAASGKTLILVDGMPAYDPSTISTAFDINQINPDAVERIEIVRGALSTLYGSDAIAGVINIITKKVAGKSFAFRGDIGGGSFSTFRGSVGIDGSVKKATYGINYLRLQSKGFSSAHDSSGIKGFDRDGFLQNSMQARVGAAITSRLEFTANTILGKYKADLDAGAFRDEKDFTTTSKNQQLTSGFIYTLSNGKLHLNYNYNATARIYLDDSTDVAGFAKFTEQHYTGRAHMAELFGNLELSENFGLLAGADRRWQNTDQDFFSISSFGPYRSRRGSDSTSMTQQSFFASIFLKDLGKFFLEAGGRYNHHAVYGSNTTYSINPSFHLLPGLKIFSNIGSAFKAPSLYQLFVINNGIAPLQPERSQSFDAGAAFQTETISLRGLFFKRSLRNGIDYNLATYQYFNNNLQQDRGAELEFNVKSTSFSGGANYTFVSGTVNTVKYVYDAATWSYKATGDTTYNNLFRRPKHQFNVFASTRLPHGIELSTHLRVAGKRMEPVFGAAPVVMEAYHTIDVFTAWQATPILRFYLDAKNILDATYFDVWGFNSRRRNFMAGLQVKF